MQTSIAQCIAMVTYGNAFLKSKETLEKFYPGNSSFSFCRDVVFVDLEAHGDHYHELPYAADPVSFLQRLKQEGYSSLRLLYGPAQPEDGDTPDWMMAGFAGGGSRWLIEARGPAGTDYWEARWDTTVDEPQDDAVWHVAYGRIVKNYTSVPPETPDLPAIKEELALNLRLISDFAREQGFVDFSKIFDESLSLLGSDNPLQNVYHKDIAPSDFLPADAVRLLAAAQTAWVFGGMGSWNDLGVEDAAQAQYLSLSSELYQTLLAAISEATNSSL